MTQRFGNIHTLHKLQVLKYYGEAYAAIISHQRSLESIYIDAFAGNGEGLTHSGVKYQGSVKIALNFQLAFEKFYFIESKKANVRKLQNLASDNQNHDICVVHGDANERLPEILKDINWFKKRALVFVDPFGFQLNWTTLETMLTNTKLDAWILVPVAGSNRVFPKETSRMDEHKENRLTEFFGSDEWKGFFYQKTKTLFDDGTFRLTDDMEQKLLKLYINKIRKIATYCSEPIDLCDGSTHRFSLVFCMSNKSTRAINLARKLVGETKKRLHKVR